MSQSRRTHLRTAGALRVSGEILAHVGEGIVVVSVSDGAIVFANPRFEQMFGYSSGELFGKPISIVNAPTDKGPEETTREIQAALRSGGRWEGEVCNRRKDGTHFWCHASVSTFAHRELGPVWVSVSRDITERKRLQEELLRTKVFLESIVENIPNTVFVKDAKSLQYVVFNRATEELVGRSRADFIGKNDHDVFPKEMADSFTEHDRVVLRDRTLLDIPEETIATGPHGERILHTKKIPILDGRGEPVYLLGISEDITDRKRIEQIRERHERETAIVNDILRALNAHLHVEPAFTEVCAGLRELAGCAAVSLNLFDERREWLGFVAADAPWASAASPNIRLRAEEWPATTDILAGRPHVVRDLETEIEFPVAQLVYALGVRSVVSLPLCAGSNVVGALILFWPEVDGCHTEQMGLLNQVANAVAIAVEKGRLFAQVSAGKERLAVLSRRLMEVQESERRHLARELHDEIGQYLTGISLVLHGLEGRHPESPGTTLVEVQKVVGELITRVRDLSLDLRPAMLDDLGLLPSLLWLFKHMSPHIEVDFQHKDVHRRFPPNVEIAAYRIVQEALTNVVRHAGVGQARVLVAADDHHLNIGITDHGTGFDTDARLAAGTTAGLSGMRERAEFMGGRLTVESRPGAGTRVHAEFDLDRN